MNVKVAGSKVIVTNGTQVSTFDHGTPDKAKAAADAIRADLNQGCPTAKRQVCRKCTSSCVPAVTLALPGNRRLHWCAGCAEDAERYRDQGSSVINVERVARGLAGTFGTPGKAAGIVRDTLAVLRDVAGLPAESMIELDALQQVADRLDEMDELIS